MDEKALMRDMKLPLGKCGSLLRGEVGWIRARLHGVQKLKVLGHSLYLRQVFQSEWVIVVGKNDVFIFEPRL